MVKNEASMKIAMRVIIEQLTTSMSAQHRWLLCGTWNYLTTLDLIVVRFDGRLIAQSIGSKQRFQISVFQEPYTAQEGTTERRQYSNHVTDLGMHLI